MIIPLGDDDSQRRTFPWVNLLLILANVVVYIYVYYLSGNTQNIIDNYAVIPLEIVQGQDVAPPGPSPLWITLFTAMFLHANWLHIGGNMLFLFIFGDNVEDAFGHLGYLIFYFICGIVAGLAQVAVVEMFQGAQGLLGGELGASGAIAGVLGAYIIMFPHARIRTLIGFGIVFFTRLSATIVIGAWIILQFIPGITTIHAVGGGVAYFAHVGGFVAGAILALIFRPRRLQPLPPPPYYPGTYQP